MRSEIVALLLLICACSTRAQIKYIHSDSLFTYANYKYIVRTIHIHLKQNNALIQKIVPEENGAYDLPQDQVFIVADMNFDGINDIRLVQYLPAGTNNLSAL